MKQMKPEQAIESMEQAKAREPSYIKYSAFVNFENNICPDCRNHVQCIYDIDDNEIKGYVYCENCRIMLRDTELLYIKKSGE